MAPRRRWASSSRCPWCHCRDSQMRASTIHCASTYFTQHTRDTKHHHQRSKRITCTHCIPDAAADAVAGLLVSAGKAVELVGRLGGDGGGRDTYSPGKHVSGVVAHNYLECRRGLCQHPQLQRIDMNLKQRVLVALHRYLRDGARMRGHMCVLGACACACKHGSTILADWTGYTPRSYM